MSEVGVEPLRVRRVYGDYASFLSYMYRSLWSMVVRGDYEAAYDALVDGTALLPPEVVKEVEPLIEEAEREIGEALKGVGGVDPYAKERNARRLLRSLKRKWFRRVCGKVNDSLFAHGYHRELSPYIPVGVPRIVPR